jgi:S-adenosylmethionine hydrolase
MAQPLITFMSDFGHQDWFVGVVHGVIHEICPEARIVDLNHEIEPGDAARAAFILEAAADDFPPGAVHLVVVDPTVGTLRRALAISARGQMFVGPDNGVLEWGLRSPDAVAHALVDDRYHRQPVSRTFHGRDVFAPVAAHLARGVALASLGPRVKDPVRITHSMSRVIENTVVGEVCYIDRFGNALTNVLAADLHRTFREVPPDRLVIDLGGRRIRGIARTYGDAPIGTLVAIVGSSNRLEIAQVGGHAALRFGVGVGDRITVRAPSTPAEAPERMPPADRA